MPYPETGAPRTSPSGRIDPVPVDTAALFVYGSFRFPEVVRALLGRVPPTAPAAVGGWRVAALPGQVYPGLVPGEGSAAGLLMTGLTAAEWRILDDFEGEAYELRCLTLTDGRRGWAYVWLDGSAAPGGWDAELFAARHLAAFVEGCIAWRGRLS